MPTQALAACQHMQRKSQVFCHGHQIWNGVGATKPIVLTGQWPMANLRDKIFVDFLHAKNKWHPDVETSMLDSGLDNVTCVCLNLNSPKK